MDEPKGSTITSKRMSQLDTRRRNTIRPVRTDGTETNCVEILKSPSDGPKNIVVNIWIRSCQLISHTQPQGKSEKCMRTILLLASTVKDQCLDQWRTGQISHKPFTNLPQWNSKWRNQIRTSQNICDSENVNRRKSTVWNVNGNDGDGTIGHKILPSLQLGGRHRNGKNGKNNLCSFALKKEQPSFVQGVSLTGNSDSLVCDEVCKQHTAPRGSYMCHSHNFSRVHVAQVLEPNLDRIVGLYFLRALKDIPSHSCSTALFLTHSCLRTSPSFLTLPLGLSTSLSLLYPSASPSTAPLQGGLCFGRLAEQSLLTGYEP